MVLINFVLFHIGSSYKVIWLWTDVTGAGSFLNILYWLWANPGCINLKWMNLIVIQYRGGIFGPKRW
jgi:hypothetical protein